MKNSLSKNIIIFLLLAGAVCLTTGIDQYVHTLVCHHESHCQTESHGKHFSDHSGKDPHYCSVCQFFACGYHKTLPCNTLEVTINPAPALWEMPENTITLVTVTVYDKISRAPPFAC